MAGYQFRLEDLDDPSRVAEALNPSGYPIKTTGSKNGTTDRMTMFSMSQILMGTPGLKSAAEVLSGQGRQIFAGLSSIIGLLGDAPGLEAILPDEFQAELRQRAAQRSTFSPLTADGKIPPWEGDFPKEAQVWINKVVALARGEQGYKENPPGSNKQKFAASAGVADGKPWSAIFLMAMFIDANLVQTKLLDPSARDTYSNYRDNGRTGQDPKVGSLAFMSSTPGRRFIGNTVDALTPAFLDSITSLDVVDIDHVGLVTKVEGDTLTVIEGDTAPNPDKGGLTNKQSGIVLSQKRNRNTIIGYAYPVYPDGVEVKFPPPPPVAADFATGQTPLDTYTPNGEIVQGATFSWPGPPVEASYDGKGPMPGAVNLFVGIINKFNNQTFDAANGMPGNTGGSVTNLGIYNFRTIGGSSRLSIHSEGRAMDVGVPTTAPGLSLGNAIFNALASNAVKFGVQRIIWNRQQWDSRNLSGKSYGGQSDHRDHLHVELTREAAGSLTYDQVQQGLFGSSSGATNPYL